MDIDIYELIKSGRTADELAEDFTNQLNDAVTRINAEEEAERQAAKLAAESEETRRTAAENDIIESLFLFWNVLNKHYPDKCTEELTYDEAKNLTNIIMSLLDPPARGADPFEWLFSMFQS